MTTAADEQPVGPALNAPPTGVMPDGRMLYGRWLCAEPVDVARHGGDLWASFHERDPHGRLWTYMGYGPFDRFTDFQRWLDGCVASDDPLFYALVPRATGKAAGMAALMRIEPRHGVMELGNIWLSPDLQRTREGSEAIYLFSRHCFDDLGYRRLEWKCDALNAASRRAADRFGFSYEGLFRQHYVVKGRNRDSAWYAIIDKDWPAIRHGFECWLSADNFDDTGRQKAPLKFSPL